MTIDDARIKPNSMIILQYVGGAALRSIATTIMHGKFSVMGLPDKQFRYVVIN